jgi:energy-coupling factor transporter transmembrane protein EcfT
MLMLLLLYLQVILGLVALVFLTLNYFNGGKNKPFVNWSRGFLVAAAITIVLRMLVMFSS